MVWPFVNSMLPQLENFDMMGSPNLTYDPNALKFVSITLVLELAMCVVQTIPTNVDKVDVNNVRI